MIPAMTVYIAPAPECSQVFKIEETVIGLMNDCQVEIDQVGIICSVSLSMTDAMRVVTRIAGCSLIPYMHVMIIKGFVIQNAGPAVAAIAKFVAGS